MFVARRRDLVTGGMGFLGRHVVAALREGGGSPLVLDLPRSGSGEGVVGCDLAVGSPDFGGFVPRTVYHLAGLAHVVPRSIGEGQRFFAVNVSGTRHLLDGIERSGGLPDSLVLVSTVAVYGIEQGEDLEETTPCKAEDPYGSSKRRQEDLVLEWCERRKVRVGIVRLPLVAGPRPPGNLGAMVRALRAGRYPGIGDGRARRSMVLAVDVAQILPKVAAIGGVFHLTDGCHPSFRELEEALCSAIGRRPPRRTPLVVARVMARSGDVLQKILGRGMPFSTRTLKKMTSTLTFSDRKARQDLGWAPRPVLEAAGEIVR